MMLPRLALVGLALAILSVPALATETPAEGAAPAAPAGAETKAATEPRRRTSRRRRVARRHPAPDAAAPGATSDPQPAPGQEAGAVPPVRPGLPVGQRDGRARTRAGGAGCDDQHLRVSVRSHAGAAAWRATAHADGAVADRRADRASCQDQRRARSARPPHRHPRKQVQSARRRARRRDGADADQDRDRTRHGLHRRDPPVCSTPRRTSPTR